MFGSLVVRWSTFYFVCAREIQPKIKKCNLGHPSPTNISNNWTNFVCFCWLTVFCSISWEEYEKTLSYFLILFLGLFIGTFGRTKASEEVFEVCERWCCLAHLFLDPTLLLFFFWISCGMFKLLFQSWWCKLSRILVFCREEFSSFFVRCQRTSWTCSCTVFPIW